MAIYWILVGVMLGVVIPHSSIYYRLIVYFLKCMNERDEKIIKQRRDIILLKLKLIKLEGEERRKLKG